MRVEEESGRLTNFGQSRRRFLKSASLLTTATALTMAGMGFLTQVPRSLESSTSNTDPRVCGIVPNCLYLPFESQEVQEKMIKNLPALNASCVRVFLDSRFEPKRIGNYQDGPIEQIAWTSKHVPIQLDLFDAYHLLHKPNPDSPYLGSPIGRSIYEQQMDILLNPQTSGALINRARTIVEQLKGEPGIWAWSLANELNLNKIGHQQLAKAVGRSLVSLHTDLFEGLIESILSIDPSRPILIGVDDPNLVDENRLTRFKGKVFNTIHVYPSDPHQKIVRDYLAVKDHSLPLVCQEVGYSRALLHVSDSFPTDEEYDDVLSKFLNETLGQLHSSILAFGPWRLTAPGDTHSDGYEIDPSKMFKTVEVIEEANLALTSNSVPNNVL